MTTISVLSPPDAKSGYRAIAAGVEATGQTAGQAIDALVERTGPSAGATLVVIQPKAGDEFFSDEQRERLADLMARWRRRPRLGNALSTERSGGARRADRRRTGRRHSTQRGPLALDQAVNALYPPIARRAENRCEYCRAPEVVFNSTFEVEHVLPTALGGTDEPSNLALACRSCNSHKGDSVDAADPDTGARVPLFNPRTERWAEHFVYDSESGAVNGLTALGRATVARLEMNHPRQLAARQLWERLRLFP